MKTSHGIFGKFIRLATAQWVRDGLHTALTIALARKSAASYGEFLLAFSLGQFIMFLGEFGLNQPMVQALSRKWGDKGQVLAQYSLIKGGFLAAGMAGVMLFAWSQGYRGDLWWLTLGICLGCALEPLAGSFFVACRVRGRQDAEATIKGLGAALGYGFALATLFLGWPAWCFALFKIVENSVTLAGGLWFTLRWDEVSGLSLGRKGLERAWGTAVAKLTFVFMALAAIGYNKANVFFLQRFGGSELVASYGVAWELVDGVSNLVSTLLLSSIIYPLLVKLWRTDQREFARLARQASQTLASVALPVMALLAMESDRVLPLIFGQTYQANAWVGAWLAPSVLIAFLHNLAAYMIMAYGKERMLLVIYVAGLAGCLGVCALLVPASPLGGAALSIVLTKAGVALCTVGYCQRRMGLLRPAFLAWTALACLTAAGLWWGMSRLAPREAAEALTLLPLLWLVWRWRPKKS